MGKLAFVFSGQGSQYSGMGKELYDISPGARALFEKAGQIRSGVKELCFSAPKEELSVTVNTQPALFCIDMAAALSLREKGVVPHMAAGFSLGEIPALAFAGCLSEETAFDFVCKRALWMTECAEENPGVMLAVLGISGSETEKICAGFPDAFPVNYNSPLQTVIACVAGISDALTQKLKENGAKAVKLPVSGAFHSPFMNKAGEKIKNYLDQVTFGSPVIPIFSNTTATVYDNKYLLSKQVSSPVLWQKTIENMIDSGADTFIEVGAGKTLCGLIRKINSNVCVLNVEDESSLNNTLEVLSNA